MLTGADIRQLSEHLYSQVRDIVQSHGVDRQEAHTNIDCPPVVFEYGMYIGTRLDKYSDLGTSWCILHDKSRDNICVFLN